MKDLIAEIGLVRVRQTRLVEEVNLLDRRIALLEREVGKGEPAPAPPPAAAPVMEPKVTPPPMPPVPIQLAHVSLPQADVEVPATEPAAVEPESIEIRFGTVWAVRLGIFIFLTGLVFLGSYTYDHFVAQLGPFARAAMLYAMGGGLIATGWWLEKRERMENFARVVLAGGLAAVFFTTWASHYLAPLRWIESATVAATLLLGWTAVMGWLADRRKSQLLAGFSLLLAYYTCTITPAAGYSLIAMLVLSAAAVFFLVRNGWTALALAALPATYGAFAFWQFFYPVVIGRDPMIDPGVGLGFLSCYWLVFTTAIFVASREIWREGMAAAWAGLNNLALFSLGTAVLIARGPGHLWIWSAVIGLASLALAYVAERRRPEATAISQVYLATGLIFVTVALFQKWAGFSLALLLAAESLALLLVSHRHWRGWYLAGSVVTSALALMIGIHAMEGSSTSAGWAAAAIALVQIGQGWMEDRRARPAWPSLVFASYGVLMVLALVMETAAPASRSVWLAGLALLAIPGFNFHRYRALTFCAHLWLASALILSLTGYLTGAAGATTVVFVAIASMAVAQWWQRQQTLPLPAGSLPWLQLLFATVEGGLSLALIVMEVPAPWRMFAMAALAIGFIVKAAVLGSGWSAAVGLALGLVAAGGTSADMLEKADARWLDLGTLFVLATATGTLATSRRWKLNWVEDGCDFVRRVCSGGGCVLLGHVCLGTALIWIFSYQPLATATWTVALMGLAIMAASRFQPALRQAGIAGAAVLAVAVAAFCWQLPKESGLAASAIVVPLALLGTRRLLEPEHPGASLLLLTGIGLLWWYLTARLIDLGGGFALTIGWALLAASVFGVGLCARDRGYRWSGLTILAASLVRLIFFDLWQLGTLTRVLSCMVLGLLLVGIGFVYNRFAERVKRYL